MIPTKITLQPREKSSQYLKSWNPQEFRRNKLQTDLFTEANNELPIGRVPLAGLIRCLLHKNLKTSVEKNTQYTQYFLTCIYSIFTL